MKVYSKLVVLSSGVVFVSLTFLAVLFGGSAIAASRADSSNRVVIMIDGSGSYKSRQGDAVTRSIKLLDAMAQAKLHRWEPVSDQITIISLDAVPEVLWRGTLKELKTLDRTAWTARFQARRDYASCTDVGTAFKLATQHLKGDSRSVAKYLFAFTDLINEPPTTSIRSCRKPLSPSIPPGDFPWNDLTDVSVSVFWVPAEQKLAWSRLVEEHGLGTTFALYSLSESSEVNVAAPARAKVELTDAERKAEKERYIGFGSSLLTVMGSILLLVLLLPVIAVVTSRFRRSRSVTVPSQFRSTVPPLNLNRNGGRTPSSPDGPQLNRPRLPLPPRSQRQQ